MIVTYKSFEEFPGWEHAPGFFKPVLEAYGLRTILEVGAGARPTLSPDFVKACGLSYTTSDINLDELQKADPVFERLVLDLSHEVTDPALRGRFDCVLSRMVGEHIQDGRQFHRNLFNLLQPGGISMHCLAALGTVPFVVNRLLPNALSTRVLDLVGPRDKHLQGKFPAFYSWSRGPTRSMISDFESLGFEVLEYTGYFGHGYYRLRLPFLEPLEKLKTRLLVDHPVPQLCSYATLVMRKPLAAASTHSRP